ncbi:CIA30 family protein-like protein [Calycina marina]|uniref:CIA30 family protein-like protein n=1 Tax=Calycina marina TaxID=1763456 RepID=A0A9P8CDX0_9HELO|nr:CIA30 family protein-like protein [Calycina marina]
MAKASSELIYLFGGDSPWQSRDWTSSDDRVRGGASKSHLTCLPFSSVAVFHGHLDTKTLGGAGFASQRTTSENRLWDISHYDGLELDIKETDGKRYTFILKDRLLPKSPNGREQSTVSWEYDFQYPEADEAKKVFIAWKDLKPTYRGREKQDAEPLDLKRVRRVSLMMRSFFGSQEGDFSLSITSIAATKISAGSSSWSPYRHDPDALEEKDVTWNKGERRQSFMAQGRAWFAWLCDIVY